MTDPGSVAVIFANLKGNVGDFAIFDAMLRSISKAYPDHRIDVYPHAFLDVDEQRLSAFLAAGEIDFNIAGETYYFPVSGFLRPFFRLGVWPHIQRKLIDRTATKSLGPAEEFSDYKAVFIAGGDHWNGMKLGISMFGTLKAIASHNKNILAFPFSVNPAILSYNKKADLHRYFSLIEQPLIVRDSISQDVLADIGIETTLGLDTVFGLRKTGLSIAPMPDRDPARIILALAKGYDGEMRERSLHHLIDRLQVTGHEVELLTTCELEDKDVIEELAQQFALTIRAPMTWQEVVAELQQSSLVVTNRLHCLILGTFAECTLFPVADRKKAQAFVHDVGLGHHAMSIEEISTDALEAAMQARSHILKRMRSYRDASHAGATTPCPARVEARRPGQSPDA